MGGFRKFGPTNRQDGAVLFSLVDVVQTFHVNCLIVIVDTRVGVGTLLARSGELDLLGRYEEYLLNILYYILAMYPCYPLVLSFPWRKCCQSSIQQSQQIC